MRTPAGQNMITEAEGFSVVAAPKAEAGTHLLQFA